LGVMTMPRRNFLRLLVLGVPAVAIPVVLYASPASRGPLARAFSSFGGGKRLSDFRKASSTTFSEVIGQPFRVVGHGAMSLELAAVETSGPKSYSLYFLGPKDKPLPQATYEFHHESVGKFQMFIVPGRPRNEGQDYTAVINHDGPA
jgi:hypothetical protein